MSQEPSNQPVEDSAVTPAPETDGKSTQQGWFRRLVGMPGRAARWTWDAKIALAAATGGGVLTFLAYPNPGLWPLAFVSLVPLMLVLRDRTAAEALVLGWWMGVVTNLGGFYWITNLLEDFGSMPRIVSAPLWFLLSVQQGFTFGLAAAFAVAARRRTTLPAVLRWPAALVLAEWATPMIFKWYLGNSQFRNLALSQWIEVGGLLLVTAFLAATAAAITQLWSTRTAAPSAGNGSNEGSARSAWIALTVVAVCWGLGAGRLAQIDRQIAQAETFRVGMVEADVGIFEKSDASKFEQNLLTHQQLSAAAAEQGAALIVWPETAYLEREYWGTNQPVATLQEAQEAANRLRILPSDVTWLPPSDAPLVSVATEDDARRAPTWERVPPQRGFRTPMLIGTVLRYALTDEERATRAPVRGQQRTHQLSNAALLLDADGRVLGSADKIALMPFSERVAGGHWLWRTTGINLFDLIPQAGDFRVGTPQPPFRLPREDGEDVRIGVMICYEDLMPQLARQMAAHRPHFLVNITNDAWFGQTSEPWLHLALATARTIEVRTALVRSTNTGVTAFVDPAGRITSHTSIQDAEILVSDVPLMPARQTLYVQLGDWPVAAAILLLVLGTFQRRRRSSTAGI